MKSMPSKVLGMSVGLGLLLVIVFAYQNCGDVRVKKGSSRLQSLTINCTNDSTGCIKAGDVTGFGYCTEYSTDDPVCGRAGCGGPPNPTACPSTWNLWGETQPGGCNPLSTEQGAYKGAGGTINFECASKADRLAPVSGDLVGFGYCIAYPQSHSKCGNAGCGGGTSGCAPTWIFSGAAEEGGCIAGSTLVTQSDVPATKLAFKCIKN